VVHEVRTDEERGLLNFGVKKTSGGRYFNGATPMRWGGTGLKGCDESRIAPPGELGYTNGETS